jgi:type II secretory pathway pseudopilin PulG
MEPKTRQRKRSAGFSLGEMLVTVVIGGMLLTAVLGIYNRANRAAVAVLEKIDSPSLAAEVLQLIGEDIDRGFGADDMILQIRNGFDGGYVRSDLVLRRLYHDKDNKEQTLDEITWRAASDGSGLVLYRSREGAGQEDKLLEDQREDWEKNYPFVPICRGLTFFQVQAVKGEELLDQWPPSAPPAGVKVTISFAEPYETIRGTRTSGRKEDQPNLRG